MTSVVASKSFPAVNISTEESHIDTLKQGSDDLPITLQPLPLGSVVELQVDYICATTLAEAEILQELIEGKEGNQLSVRGRLQLQGGSCQRSVACAFVTVEVNHCDSYPCFRLQSDTRNQVTLRFELSPDVVTNSLPQFDLTIRSKKSHKGKLSFSIALGYLVQNLFVGVDFQTKLGLLDDQDRFCGHLNAKFRGGLLNDLENNAQEWNAIMYESVGCILTVKVSELQATGAGDKDCVAKIWSSTGGKLRGQTVSPIMLNNGGSSTEPKAVSLQVIDVATDIIFVGIYRYSSHERNELIGLGRFCVHQLKFPEDQPLELCVNLFLESAGKEIECGSAMLSLERTSVPTEDGAEKTISLAATGLGSIAYPVKTGEMKCRLNVDILEVQALPTNIQEGDDISIQLRVGQSNWKAELAPVKVSVDTGGKMIAIVNENVHSVIRWAAKDRSFPVLEVSVYVKRQQKLNRFGMVSKASLATSSHGKRRQAKATQPTNNAEAPVLVATGSLHLSSFFLQQDVSALTDLRLDLEKTLVDNAKTAPDIMTILLTLRASSSQESGSKIPTSPECLSRVLQPVKGDICIHLLQASGSSLRKSNSPSSYYASISSGSQEIISSCCDLDDEYTLTWNQQLAIPIACARPPVIYLTIYSRNVDSIAIQPDTSSDQVIGYLTLPLFPSILNEDHLLQLELPFGLPTSELVKQNNDPHYFKRGLITLEVQFLPEQPNTGLISLDIFELVIHQLRGNFLGSEGFQHPSGFAKHVIIDFSILVDRGGVPEELGIGLSRAIALSSSCLTEVGEVIDLSNPIIAATLSNDSSNVLVGRIRDLTGQNYGRVHLPLRTDWKERLVNRKKQVWCPVCMDSTNGDVTTTKNAVLMSLQLCEQRNLTLNTNPLGNFHINICEAIFTSDFSASLMKLGKYSGANIQLTYISDDPINAIRSRTRQSTDQSSQRWRWENEWFVFTHEEGINYSQELHVSLQIGVQTIHPQLEGRLDLLSLVEAAKLRHLDFWVPLADQSGSDDATASAQLHVLVSYLPTIMGTLTLEFGENYALSQPERSLQVEKTFHKCTFHGASFSTIVAEDQESNANSTRLRLPIDTKLVTSVELPEITIQMMGVTKTLGEICLGEASIDLLEISDLCCLLPSPRESLPVERFIWREFTDRSDRTKTTGIVKLHVGFEEILAQREITGNAKTREKRGVASAELFTIWKKLFYLLDQNNNGYIDRNEFTDVFVNHLDDMTGTSDGRKLLQLLFGDENNEENDIAPTQQQISTLFALMDTNRDNEIEWSEYLRFLQQRRQRIFREDDESSTTDIPEVTFEQKRELRRKNREDQRKPPSTESNQDELPPEKTREAHPTVIQEPAPPKRPGKVSSSEEKRLKLHYSNQEHSRLQQQVTALESILAIERRRYAELAADRQALMRSYQQLHLKHQNELLQEQTKAKWMKQTIERQQQQLEEREQLRRNRNEASIVLQSTVRSRLEQKRYQGLKLQRINAAVTIQCLVRQMRAKRQFQALKELDRVVKLRASCASKMQRFIRFQLHRKERALLVEARVLSATILQKNSRRMLAGKAWRTQKMMALKLQCWIRQRRAARSLTQRRVAVSTVKSAVLRWFTRWKYVKIVTSCRKIQRWWRRASKERSAYMTQMEASLCIQSAWKRRTTRKWFKREWQRQEKYIAHLEATMCIQAAWRGRRQRSKSVRSGENTPRYNDDSATEALLYDLVAMVEAGVVIPSVLNESTSEEIIVDEEVAPEDPIVSNVKDVPVSGEENDIQVQGVLNDLVEAVINADTDGIVESEGDIEVPHDEGSGDQSCPDQEVVLEQNTNLDDMEEPDSLDIVVESDGNVASDAPVQSEIADGLDKENLSIIRNLLVGMVETVTTTAEVAVLHEDAEQILQRDSSRNKPLEALPHDLVGSSIHSTEEAQTVNEMLETNIDKELVISAEEEANNSSEEVSESVDINQSDTTNAVAGDIHQEDDSIMDHQSPDEVAIAPASTGLAQQPVDAEVPDIFDTNMTEGDLLVPDMSDSDEANSDNEGAGGSNIDSTDLMMEADAMAVLQDTPDSETLSVVAPAPRHRKTTRVDSLVLLADVDKLNAQH